MANEAPALGKGKSPVRTHSGHAAMTYHMLTEKKSGLTNVKENHVNNNLWLYFFSHKGSLGPFFPPGFSNMFIKRKNSSR